MTIFRVNKNKNFVVMDKTPLQDTRLSWKAKGIIAYMLSMPDDWVFHMSELVNHSTDGEKAFRSGMKELKECGYVARIPIYEDRKIVRWETIINENPALALEPSLLAQKVQVQNVQVQKVQVQNDVLLNNNNTKNNNTKNDILSGNPTTPSETIKIPFVEIIDYLNKKANTRYKAHSKATQKLIKARFEEGFTFEEFKTVIDIKVSHWLEDEGMNQYLRPQTLFGTKFESYLNQKVAKVAVGATTTNDYFSDKEFDE